MQHTIIERTLPNGISLVMVPLPSTEAVTTMVLMGVGSRYESDRQQGLAHFTEHMVFKGGRTYQTAQAVAQALDAVGGEFNAFTSEEFTGFFAKTDGQHVELGLDVLSDMVLHATFPADELEKEKGVISEEINMYEDLPMRKVHEVLSELVFGDTPLGRPIAGTKASVAAFTREDFTRYREQFYNASKCTVILAGSLDPETVPGLVERYFGELPSGGEYAPQPASFQAPKRVALETRQSEQTHLLLAVQAIPLDDPRRYAFHTLSTILGGNMSSRLFVSVRERQGLCYYVRSSADSYVDTGTLICSAGVDNGRLPQAIAAIVKELQLLRDQPVGDDELQRAKQNQIGHLALSLEDSVEVAERYGLQRVLEGSIERVEDTRAGIEAVTAEDIQALARELFTDERLRLAAVGPFSDVAALEELLTLN